MKQEQVQMCCNCRHAVTYVLQGKRYAVCQYDKRSLCDRLLGKQRKVKAVKLAGFCQRYKVARNADRPK